MNCLECNFARKFPGDCKYVVCDRFGGFRRVDGECPKACTNGERLRALDDLQLASFCVQWDCPPLVDCGKMKNAGCDTCWEKWLESPADMEFWRNFEAGERGEDD